MTEPWKKYTPQETPAGPWAKYGEPKESVSVKVTSGGTEIGGEAPEEKSLAGFAGNVVNSGARFGGDIWNAVTSPVQTAKALGGLGAGLAEKLIPGEQGQEKNVDALVNMYVDRYGGLENLKKTAYEDPVGMLADFATLAGGAGIAAKGVGLAAKTANLAKTAEVAGKVAQVAGTVSDITDPTRMLTRPAAAALSATKIPERLYESALKPSLSARNTPKIPGQLATGLTEGIPISEGGVRKIARQLQGLRESVNEKIAGAKGVTIDPEEVAKRLDATELGFSEQALPKQDLQAIDAARSQWLEQFAIKDAEGNTLGYRQIPLDEAQKLKVGTYKVNAKKYGELSAASMEAEKALARGIKEELETALPELKDLNAKSGALMELNKQLTHAVRRKGNWEIFGPGIYGSLGGIGVGMATGSSEAGVVTGAMLTLLRDPNVKSRLAIAISRARGLHPERYGNASLATASSRVQEYIDSLSKYQGGTGQQ